MTFEVGQKVVYPTHGVCLVEDISAAKFDNVEQTFCHMRVLANQSKVMVPQENLDLVGLRPLCTQEEIDHLFSILRDGNIDTYKDWKGRYKQNLDKMKTGSLLEVAEVLKNLCLVSQKKSLSFREKKMYERARYFIVSEIAHVRDITEDEAQVSVDDALQSSLDKRKKGKAKDTAKDAAKAKDASIEDEKLELVAAG